jgi:hypothetical protein
LVETGCGELYILTRFIRQKFLAAVLRLLNQKEECSNHVFPFSQLPEFYFRQHGQYRIIIQSKPVNGKVKRLRNFFVSQHIRLRWKAARCKLHAASFPFVGFYL